MVKFIDGAQRSRLTGQLAWFLAWAGVTAVGLVLRPSAALHGTHQELGLPPCPSVALFDRPCFGCGMTTSFTALLHLDFATAFRAHPFGPLFYFLFTASALACGYGWWKGKYLDTSSKAFNRVMVVITVAFVAFGIGRFATVKYNSDEYALSQFAKRLRDGEQGRQTARVPEKDAPR